ncbi:MAG: rod shape-determining protein MreD [Candidatus Binatia bacterium]
MRLLGLSLFTLVGVAAIAGLLLQTTALHMLPVGPVIPDFILILCVYLGLHQHSVGGTTAAFLLGYFADNFSGNAVGLHAFAMSLVFVLVYLVSRRLWMDNWVSNVAVVFVASMLKTVTVAALLVFYLSEDYAWGRLVSTIWFEALLAALFAPVVFIVLDRGRKLSGLD